MSTSHTALKTVVITGASRGIGKACALHMDSIGWRVFAGIRQEADGLALQAASSPRLVPLRIDVTDVDAIAGAAQVVSGAVGERGLDGLANNAGIAIAAPIEVLPIDELRRQLEVNVVGQIAVTQAFLPLLRAARGRIVNMSSVAGKISTSLLGAYSASKHALEALSDALRIELRPWDIQVAIVEPGKIDTPIWDTSRSTARRIWERLPQETRDLYAPLVYARLSQLEQAPGIGIPAEAVARAVAHALTATQPRIRYPVGRDAQFIVALARLLPTRWFDWLRAHRWVTSRSSRYRRSP